MSSDSFTTPPRSVSGALRPSLPPPHDPVDGEERRLVPRAGAVSFGLYNLPPLQTYSPLGIPLSVLRFELRPVADEIEPWRFMEHASVHCARPDSPYSFQGLPSPGVGANESIRNISLEAQERIRNVAMEAEERIRHFSAVNVTPEAEERIRTLTYERALALPLPPPVMSLMGGSPMVRTLSLHSDLGKRKLAPGSPPQPSRAPSTRANTPDPCGKVGAWLNSSDEPA
jgi:hypothetical protein